MRTFEIVLILVNLLSLPLGFKKQAKVVWLGVAGANLSVFLIHGIFEGFRYQMVFSYIFVVLLVAFAFVKSSSQFVEAKTPKVIKVMAISLSFVLIIFTSFLAYALPVFTLPRPTGSYDVGIMYFHFVDENRADPFLDTSASNRELMVKVYYPAMKDDAKPFSPYLHNSPELIKSFAAFYHLPDFMFDHLSLVKTNAKENLQLSDQQPGYPVILVSHGAGTTMEVQTSLSEDLASHGYIVVAIDHTYVSLATVFPDRIVSHKEATTNFNVAEPAEMITQIMADDAKFVMDKLGEMNEGIVSSIFAGKLNLDQIGMMGHSVGGAMAYNLAMNDSRVKAAINLDGKVYITPTGDFEDMAPFLMLANDNYHIQAIQNQRPLMEKYEDMNEVDQKITSEIYGSEQAYKDAYNKTQQNVLGLSKILGASGNLFTIEGSDHMKFIDIGLFIGISQFREQIGISGKTDPARCLEITRAISLAFFDQHLKGVTSDSWEPLIEMYPELKQIGLN